MVAKRSTWLSKEGNLYSCKSSCNMCMSVSNVYLYKCLSSVQFKLLSRVQLFVTPWTAARQVSLSITNSQSFLKLNGHGCGWTPGVGDGLGGLASCSSWGRKESDMTEQLN